MSKMEKFHIAIFTQMLQLTTDDTAELASLTSLTPGIQNGKNSFAEEGTGLVWLRLHLSPTPNGVAIL